MSSKNNPTLKSCKIRVGITMGDPSGVGPFIIRKALSRISRTDKSLCNSADLAVIGDRWVIERAQGSEPCAFRDCKFIDLDNVEHKGFKFGKVKPEYGQASFEYLKKAVDLIEQGELDCLVTCPISKESLGLAGLNYRGHTEYLARRTKTRDFVMMLMNKKLKIGLVTRHIPFRDVPSKLNKKIIFKTIFLTYCWLRQVFGINPARIAVCGLNPHASDNGLIGKEESRIIRPAVKKAKERLKAQHIDGPLPSDVAMQKANMKEYDCVIAMYHDQALVPLKLGGSFDGVNVTIGLPFVRTSPLHGTAFDMAKDYSRANPNSLIAAIRLAVKCSINLKKG